MAKATVLGNYVYIDGGLITQFQDGVLKERKQNQGMQLRLFFQIPLKTDIQSV